MRTSERSSKEARPRESWTPRARTDGLDSVLEMIGRKLGPSLSIWDHFSNTPICLFIRRQRKSGRHQRENSIVNFSLRRRPLWKFVYESIGPAVICRSVFTANEGPGKQERGQSEAKLLAGTSRRRRGDCKEHGVVEIKQVRETWATKGARRGGLRRC